ncbi:hypothetical protein NA57DRAFT_59014 [Rhizodiscina lignyota]|uniref:Uncharacterized protein n=1 Tax=Rhizodiscina lignyota TaxID=1504668 RepID=A0A9P4M7L6_9PEZI|nr:hypothetical protein NA57DRAFT_59014 [Rhizodiscina lignyota]
MSTSITQESLSACLVDEYTIKNNARSDFHIQLSRASEGPECSWYHLQTVETAQLRNGTFKRYNVVSVYHPVSHRAGQKDAPEMQPSYAVILEIKERPKSIGADTSKEHIFLVSWMYPWPATSLSRPASIPGTREPWWVESTSLDIIRCDVVSPHWNGPWSKERIFDRSRMEIVRYDDRNMEWYYQLQVHGTRCWHTGLTTPLQQPRIPWPKRRPIAKTSAQLEYSPVETLTAQSTSPPTLLHSSQLIERQSSFPPATSNVNPGLLVPALESRLTNDGRERRAGNNGQTEPRIWTESDEFGESSRENGRELTWRGAPKLSDNASNASKIDKRDASLNEAKQMSLSVRVLPGTPRKSAFIPAMAPGKTENTLSNCVADDFMINHNFRSNFQVKRVSFTNLQDVDQDAWYKLQTAKTAKVNNVEYRIGDVHAVHRRGVHRDKADGPPSQHSYAVILDIRLFQSQNFHTHTEPFFLIAWMYSKHLTLRHTWDFWDSQIGYGVWILSNSLDIVSASAFTNWNLGEWTKEWIIDWNAKQIGRMNDPDMKWLCDLATPRTGNGDIRSAGARWAATVSEERKPGLGSYTPAEDSTIIDLRENQKLSWKDIVVEFAKLHAPRERKSIAQRYQRFLSRQRHTEMGEVNEDGDKDDES